MRNLHNPTNVKCVRYKQLQLIEVVSSYSSNMGGHGHGHGDPYKVPDASIYKVENAPKLLEVQEALARQGLRDPWLR